MDFRRGREKTGSRQVIEATNEMKDVLKPGDGASAPPIRLGDTVVFFEGREAIGFDRMRHKTIWQCRHGAFHHNDIIGKPFGCRVFSRSTMGHVYALSPTPELWCQVVPSRTQIVQDFDQSIVIFRLDLKPGDVVVESGTGSGVMSTAIMRTIAPTGFLHTFEFNEIRAKSAREEFKENELGELVRVLHRDVCAGRDQGGGFGHELDGKADAVFLDLPEPWLAVPHAKLVLKSGKKIASYSPCIEQVMKTCEALRSEGFHSVTSIECRLRPINYAEVELDTPDFGLSAASTPSAAHQKQAATAASATSSGRSPGQLGDEKSSEVGGVERGSCGRDDAGGNKGIEDVIRMLDPDPKESAKVEGIESTDAPTVKDGVKNGNGHGTAGGIDQGGTAVDTSDKTAVTELKKRARSQMTGGTDRDTAEYGVGRGRSERLPSKAAIRAAESAAARGAELRVPRKLVCAQPFPVMRGHTAFLTFATTPVARRPLTAGVAATIALEGGRWSGAGGKVDKEESKGEMFNGDGDGGDHANRPNSSTSSAMAVEEARLVLHGEGESKVEDEDFDNKCEEKIDDRVTLMHQEPPVVSGRQQTSG